MRLPLQGRSITRPGQCIFGLGLFLLYSYYTLRTQFFEGFEITSPGLSRGSGKKENDMVE